MADRLPTLRAVGEAGPLAAHPRSIGGGRITGTGDQGALNDAVGGFLKQSLVATRHLRDLMGRSQAAMSKNCAIKLGQ
jgi:hypothetical protein